jgi:hypothetical protein
MGLDFEDCYIIRISNPTLFSMTITAANFNTQIYLFNISLPGGGYGLLSNDDRSTTNTCLGSRTSRRMGPT